MEEIYKIIKRDIWWWIVGFVIVLGLLLISNVYVSDINEIHRYYKDKMERCSCVCLEDVMEAQQQQMPNIKIEYVPRKNES